MTTKGELIARVIELGAKSGQFTASKGKDTDVVIEREIVNADYYELVGEEKVKKNYQAYMLLDEGVQDAKYNEQLTDASSKATVGPDGLKFGTSKGFFKGKTFGTKEFDKTFAIKKDTKEPGKVVDYTLEVNRIRNPIQDLLSQSNWKFTLVTSRKDASYKKKGLFG